MNNAASANPVCSIMRVNSELAEPSGTSANSSAIKRVRAVTSCSIASSVLRASVMPDSRLFSTLTLNQDSIERDRNCTDTV